MAKKQSVTRPDLPVNANGLTFFRWIMAAGNPLYWESLRPAWKAGEDPAEYRKDKVVKP